MTERPEEVPVVQDRSRPAWTNIDSSIRDHVKSLITDDLIEEHKARPLGQHSDALERVLNYFRRGSLAGKYLIVATKPFQEYRIGIHPGVRGQPVRLLDDVYTSEQEVFHAVFLRRVNDLLAT
ncbi:MAG TPA: inner-membrane translocator [Actinomycetes bacterium]|jgi:branched-chain amino acid transport system permease protein|nr:inner-membrane translocator [Actinomycetes bacterium]